MSKKDDIIYNTDTTLNMMLELLDKIERIEEKLDLLYQLASDESTARLERDAREVSPLIDALTSSGPYGPTATPITPLGPDPDALYRLYGVEDNRKENEQ